MYYTLRQTVSVDNGETPHPVWEMHHENSTIIVPLTMQFIVKSGTETVILKGAV